MCKHIQVNVILAGVDYFYFYLKNIVYGKILMMAESFQCIIK